jgi:hypothetical protein
LGVVVGFFAIFFQRQAGILSRSLLKDRPMNQVSFRAHPASVGESYGEHLAVASSFGAAMLLGGLACLVHGLLPFLFTRTGSGIVRKLHDRMLVNRAAAVSRTEQTADAA